MNQRGMTLLEVLLVLGLSSLFFCTLIPCATQLYTTIHTMQKDESEQLDIQTAITFIQDEVRNARAVQVWGSRGQSPIYKEVEVYHNPQHLIDNQVIYLHSIVVQSKSTEKQSIQLGTQGNSLNRGYLTYQGANLLENFHAISIHQQHEQLIFTITIQTKDKTYKHYPFLIEEDNKLYEL